MLEKVLIKEFILHRWGDWKGIVTEVEKNQNLLSTSKLYFEYQYFCT